MIVATSWQQCKLELMAETERITQTCPEEIERFHYGIITHSDAGKYPLNQYFGHWVHLYAEYYYYSGEILASIQRLAKDPTFELAHLQKMFCDVSSGWPASLSRYAGQISLGTYLDKMYGAIDTIKTKEEFLELLQAFQAYVCRLYWWVHWYFPWGIGPGVFPRRSKEDIAEIIRLSQ